MILPNVCVESAINQDSCYFGIDRPEIWTRRNLDFDSIKQFPYDVHYTFNSRGFRDHEWPTDISELKSSVWLVGSSFSMGIGNPQDQTLSAVLEEKINQRVINVGMGGSTNQWIQDQALQIINEISPSTMIIHWTLIYLVDDPVKSIEKLAAKQKFYYQSIKDPSWPDDVELSQLSSDILKEIENSIEFQRVQQLSADERLDITTRVSNFLGGDNFLECFEKIESNKKNTQIIHCFPPSPESPNLGKFARILNTIKLQQVIEYRRPWNPEIEDILYKRYPQAQILPSIDFIDLARDQLHYGIKTTHAIADQIVAGMK